MRGKMLGFRRVDMMDDRNRPIVGHSCFVGYPSRGVEGMETTKVFVSDELAAFYKFVPLVNGEVDLQFDPRGRLAGISNVNK